jgi:hypothetical protein
MQGASFVLIVGMHRSGTSCLAGALEACGLWLGEVGRGDKWNAKGSREHDPARLLNDRILEDGGGSWSAPPDRIAISPAQRAAMAAIARELSARAPAGLKDPRVALLLDDWRAAIGAPSLVGTYRHPVSVAASLARRNQMPAAAAHALWCRYNEPLVAAHRARPFPIVAFDLTDPERYCATIEQIAAGLGLESDPERLRGFVSAQLDHARELDKVVPPECLELWNYLESVQVSVAPRHAAAAASPAPSAATRSARPRIDFVSGPTCAGKSHYMSRHLPPGGRVLLPDKGARLAIAEGGRFFLHYNLLRPFEKFDVAPGDSLGRRFRRVRRRLRARIVGPFSTDRRLMELLALPADFEARVLVVPKRELLARIAERKALEPLRAESEGYPSEKWDAIVRAVDLPELYRAWLRFLRTRGIPYRLVDARDETYRPIADERALEALLAVPGEAP